MAEEEKQEQELEVVKKAIGGKEEKAPERTEEEQ